MTVFSVTIKCLSSLSPKQGNLSEQLGQSGSELERQIMSVKNENERKMLREMLEFELALDLSKKSPKEEGVPTEMLSLFAEDQWGQLIFEFQPSMMVIETALNTVQRYGQIKNGERPAGVKEERSKWILFNDGGSMLVRPICEEDYQVMAALERGADIAHTEALVIGENKKKKLAQIIGGWMEEELVVDVGVPMPKDAVYEDEKLGLKG